MPREEPAFKLKNANPPLFVLHLATTDLDRVSAELDARVAQTPDFFEQTPALLSLAGLEHPDTVPDFAALAAAMRPRGLVPVGLLGGSPAQRAAAAEVGLAWFGLGARPARPEPAPAPEPVAETPVQAEIPGLEAAPVEPAPEPPAPPPVMAARRPTLVIDKPVRTGQRIYAEDSDLVVLAIVTAGAELIADGDIHIYAPLRGRALAGARGDVTARIYAQSMEAELVAIAGLFQVFEDGIPAEVRGQAAQVLLEGEKVVAKPLGRR